ncbi:MAG: indole-3-glycerol phosphate synthase [Phycisphaerae bacterium]
MANILDQIVETKRGELRAAMARRPLADLKAAVRDLPPPRGFYAAIAAPPQRGIHLIAEIKRRSPSAGLIRPDFDPVRIASIYHGAGASCLSVLTDETYFDGRLEYVDQVRSAVPLPVLRKDFIIDAYQVYEARAAGADAVLLIGEVLPASRLKELLDLAFELGLTSLIEVHEPETLDELRAVVRFPNDKRSLLGVNNRNLKIQRTDLATFEKLSARVAGTLLVAESGIRTPADVQRMIAAGARALLVGESLMRSPDIAAAIEVLLGPSPGL